MSESTSTPEADPDADAALDEEYAHLVPDDEDPQEVLADVQRALEQVARVDVHVTDHDDLRRVVSDLPTEPHRARLVHAGLPPLLRNAIEYVEPSERQSGYWRRSRERSDPAALSDAEIKQRLAFIESRMDNREEFGTVATEDGRRISRSAAQTGDDLRGETFRDADDARTTDTTRTKGKGLLRRILDRLP